MKTIKIIREVRPHVPTSLEGQIRKNLPSEEAEYLLSRIVGWVDATEKAGFAVTEEDVKHAIPGNCYRCAGALGVQRYWPDTVFVAINHSTMWRVRIDGDIDGYIAVRYSTPRKLRTQIDNIDAGRDFKPGDYHVCPPTAPAPKGDATWRGTYPGNEEHQNCSDKATHPKDGTPCHKCGYKYTAHPRTKHQLASRSFCNGLTI